MGRRHANRPDRSCPTAWIADPGVGHARIVPLGMRRHGNSCDTRVVTTPWCHRRMNARSWTQPLAPALGVPDRFMHLRLMRDDAWLSEAGTWDSISELALVD